jgi:hypothetical protein
MMGNTPMTNMRKETLEIIKDYYQILEKTNDDELKASIRRHIFFLLEEDRKLPTYLLDGSQMNLV